LTSCRVLNKSVHAKEVAASWRPSPPSDVADGSPYRFIYAFARSPVSSEKHFKIVDRASNVTESALHALAQRFPPTYKTVFMHNYELKPGKYGDVADSSPSSTLSSPRF